MGPTIGSRGNAERRARVTASASIVMLEVETFLGQNGSYLALIDAKKQLNRAIQHIPP